jgi:8-oxo-dGTP diphosphatase
VSGREGRRVRAAGGLVWRSGEGGEVELVVVHRPRYDDWSLPKGKAHAGERAVDTALREVQEETGLRCTAAQELAKVRYRTERGEDKTVRWWAMSVTEDLGFEPNDEVDAVRWVSLEEFEQLATFPTDREVVHSFVTSGRPPSP